MLLPLLANLDFAGGGGTPTPTPSTPATGRSRRRRRYSVEVDNQFFLFDSIYEVESFLADVRQTAAEEAERLVTTPVTPKPPRIRVKTGSGKPTTSQVLQQAVRRTQKLINTSFINAAKSRAIEAELSQRIQQRIKEDDDEEAILALLLS